MRGGVVEGGGSTSSEYQIGGNILSFFNFSRGKKPNLLRMSWNVEKIGQNQKP